MKNKPIYHSASLLFLCSLITFGTFFNQHLDPLNRYIFRFIPFSKIDMLPLGILTLSFSSLPHFILKQASNSLRNYISSPIITLILFPIMWVFRYVPVLNIIVTSFSSAWLSYLITSYCLSQIPPNSKKRQGEYVLYSLSILLIIYLCGTNALKPF